MLPPPGGYGPSRPHQVLPLSAPQVAQADLAYHDVLRFCGLYLGCSSRRYHGWSTRPAM
jgi:hypothetical protein